MHPAYSIIFFTTASGAGYGLLALLGLAAFAGVLPADRWLGLVGTALALMLVTAGLLSSALHLGRPERAIRAFSQWRSSWLSREGVLAIATFVPAGLLGIGWGLLGRTDGWVAWTGLAAAIGAAATVSATAMIYATITPVAHWHSPFTLPAYLLFAAMTGLTLLNGLLYGFGMASTLLTLAALAATLAGWWFKVVVWRHNDAAPLPATANSATGLAGGTVRSVEWPHTEENYLLKEMGYRIARKHARRLRLITRLLAFAGPAALLAISIPASGPVAVTAALLAVAAQLAGMLVERWLFFAEATHTVTLYYRP